MEGLDFLEGSFWFLEKMGLGLFGYNLEEIRGNNYYFFSFFGVLIDVIGLGEGFREVKIRRFLGF